MARKRRTNGARAGELNLTAMIDMAFQLLAFFVITVAPIAVVTHLNADHVSGVVRGQQGTPLSIKVLTDGNYAFNGRGVTKDALASLLNDNARLDRKQTVLIACALQSPHQNLIDVLDLCHKAGFDQLALGSAE